MTRLRSVPDEHLRRLELGRISASRAAIVGGESMLFSFEAETGRTAQYRGRNPDPIGESWAEALGTLHARLSPSIQIVSILVPNKETCLHDLYPSRIGRVPGGAWLKVRQMLAGDDGILYGDSIVSASHVANRTTSVPWFLTDTRPSDEGAALLSNEIMERLCLPPVPQTVEEIGTLRFAGDLSSEWGVQAVGEILSGRVKADAPVPRPVHTAGGAEWENPEALVQATLVVVGDAHTGTGHHPWHLAYWLSRVFRRTVVVPSPVVPIDVLDVLRPDVLIYQAAERYFIAPAPVPPTVASVVSLASVKDRR